MLVLFRFHDDRIENRYYGCMPRIARFTEVAGYKSGFWSKDPKAHLGNMDNPRKAEADRRSAG